MEIFNHATALTNASNDPEFLAEIAVMFFEDAAIEIKGLRAAVEAQDHEKISFHAHTLKGMAGNLGGESLHAICLQAETAGRASDFAGARKLLPQVEAALEALSGSLKALCK